MPEYCGNAKKPVLAAGVVVVPFDFTPRALSALRVAAELAATCDGTVHLLHIDTYPGFGLCPDSHNPRYENLRAQMREAAALVARANIHIHLRGAVDVAQAIVRYAVEAGADCIVMATRPHRGLWGWMHESVTQSVVDLAACPVLTLHPQEALVAAPESGMYEMPQTDSTCGQGRPTSGA